MSARDRYDMEIVEWLREFALSALCPTDRCAQRCADAAAELDRLRAALDLIANAAEWIPSSDLRQAARAARGTAP
jgi:hypothetical protein